MDTLGTYNFNFEARTKDESLKQSLLSNVSSDSCQRLRNSDFKATHVVIGVSYGGSLDLYFRAVSF